MKSNTIQEKFIKNFLVDINKLFLKYIGDSKDVKIVKTILKKKNEVREPEISYVKNYYKTSVIKTLYWHKDILRWMKTYTHT